MYNNRSQQGYSLIETLIAVAILMLAIVAPMTIAVKSIQSSQYTLEQNTAVFLAQETLSAIEAHRNQKALVSLQNGTTDYWTWSNSAALNKCKTSYGCNFDLRNPAALFNTADSVVQCTQDGANCQLYYNDAGVRSAFRLGSGSGSPTPFTRRVYVSNVTADMLNVRVVVEWDSHFLNQGQSVSMSTSFYNMYQSF